MYKMTSMVNEGMVPQDDYIIPHPFMPDMMGRGPVEREPASTMHQRPMAAPIRAVKLVKKSRKKSFPYVCHVVSCGEKFFNSKGLDTHLQLHLGVKPFICDYCGKVCQTESKLKAHQDSHVNEGVKPVCDICERSFSSRSSLNKHKKMLHKPKPHICPQCHAGFEEHRYMAVHAKQAHNLDISVELQDSHQSCNVNFSLSTLDSRDLEGQKESSLTTGCVLSSPVTTLSRDSCSTQEKQVENVAESDVMSRRVESHINCELCTSTFPSVAYLEQHMAVHVNEKILMCHACSLDFTSHEDLVNHMKMHGTGSEGHFSEMTTTKTKCPQMLDKYICAVCREHFINLGSLKRHQAKGQCTSVLSGAI